MRRKARIVHFLLSQFGVREPLSPSTLNLYLSQLASRKAPAEALNTEKSSGAFTPSANAIAIPNTKSRTPLRNAATRVNTPIRSAKASTVSAIVAVHAIIGPRAIGTIEVSRSV
jgi:hypothetical protein